MVAGMLNMRNYLSVCGVFAKQPQVKVVMFYTFVKIKQPVDLKTRKSTGTSC